MGFVGEGHIIHVNFDLLPRRRLVVRSIVTMLVTVMMIIDNIFHVDAARFPAGVGHKSQSIPLTSSTIRVTADQIQILVLLEEIPADITGHARHGRFIGIDRDPIEAELGYLGDVSREGVSGGRSAVKVGGGGELKGFVRDIQVRLTGVGHFEGWLIGGGELVARAIDSAAIEVSLVIARLLVLGPAKVKDFVIEVVKGALIEGGGRSRGGRALVGRRGRRCAILGCGESMAALARDLVQWFELAESIGLHEPTAALALGLAFDHLVKLEARGRVGEVKHQVRLDVGHLAIWGWEAGQFLVRATRRFELTNSQPLKLKR